MQASDRPSTEDSPPLRWRFANAELDERNHELVVDGAAVALEAKPLAVLLCLLRAEGELVTKEEIFDTVWAGRVVTDGVLSQAIRRIREVLADHGKTMLRTVHGYGYRLDVPIEIEGRDDPGTRLELEAGQCLPNLPDWLLEERLQTRPANELWRVRHAATDERRVVKLALDERAQRALKREVTLNKVLRNELGHEFPVVPLLEWNFDSSPAWVQMPWYAKGSLADWLNAHGGPAQLPLQRRLMIVAEAADALARAHALGVMHKDIKPGNLLVEDGTDELRLLLCDFGSGTVKSRDRLDQVGVTVMGFTQTVLADPSTSGTPAYMAPEVLKGGVFSEQSDIYALGILLYQLVIGNLNEPLAAGWEEDVEDVGLRAIIAEACAGKPSRRISSMEALAQRLRAWKPGEALGSPKSAVEQPSTVRTPSRTPALALAMLLLALGGITWMIWGGEQSSPPNHLGSSPAGDLTSANQRVAILSFELLGLDAQTQTVMGGLQDALMADLANLDGIRLVHGQNLDALGLVGAPSPQIGEALNADQLVRGSIQQLGEQVRVNLQIVDAARGEATWGQAIEGTRSDLFAVQAQIAQALASGLGTQLATPTDAAANNAAYEAYLAALALWKQGLGLAEDDRLAQALDRALSLDPRFIDAHLLALLKAARDYWFSFATRAESEDIIAKHLSVLEAQDTPPLKLATARAVRRYYLDHDPRRGVEILAPFRRQLVRNTESAMFYAYMLRRIGRVDEAFEILDEIIDQDPSAMVALETKAEILAFQGRGAEAVQTLQVVAERFGQNSDAAVKIASFAYQLSGHLPFLRAGRSAVAENAHYKNMVVYVDIELARREGDWEQVRRLVDEAKDQSKPSSGHGREPPELRAALALHAARAPQAEIQELAEAALQKITRWRAESDSQTRRSTMAKALALLGRTGEATTLVSDILATQPLERDYIEGAERLLEASTVHALLGQEDLALQRLQTLATSEFKSLSLCGVPFALERQAIWDVEAAQDYIQQECAQSWERNRRGIQAVLAEA
nr:winged helix-turn-helix domain-containing protein [Oceanococcus sp. HetDA_MAG_MS8]